MPALTFRARFSQASGRFWVIAAFLVMVAITGGSARSDVLSLILLRPMAVLVAAAALCFLPNGALRQHRFSSTILGSAIILTILHLIPLPAAWWMALPGRQPVATIDAALGFGTRWRPISLSPADTRNAAFSLAVPLAVLFLGAGLPRRASNRLVLIVVAIGLSSAVIALLQLLGSPIVAPFLYPPINYGDADGLFANRNHQAIFLSTLFPMLAATVTVGARDASAPRNVYGAIAAVVFLIPLLLVTGSRAGILAGGLGLLSMPLLLRLPRGQWRRSPHRLLSHFRTPIIMAVIGVILIAALVILVIGLSRAVAVTRLLQVGADEELRFRVWPIILAAIPTYLPLGSGVGSFVPVFQMIEPDSVLHPTYLNHAHNEVLEILLTAGLPGAALLVASIGGWAVAAWSAFRTPLLNDGNLDEPALFRRLGVVVAALLAFGSLADYPLRTPFLAALLMLAALWCGGEGVRSAKRPSDISGPPGSGDIVLRKRIDG